MLHFSKLSTRRLREQMRELNIGESVAVAKFPDSQEEAAVTAMLRACCTSSTGAPGLDPLHWTLQERTLGIAHYLMAMDPMNPDFELGSDGHFSDYLQAESDVEIASLERPIVLGELEGDHWGMQHLLGYMLEAIERTEGMVAIPGVPGECMRGSLHWTFGTMAAQLVRVQIDSEGNVMDLMNPAPDPLQVGVYDDWLIQAMTVLASYPDSTFVQLKILYGAGKQRQHHLFDWVLSRTGRPVILPNPKKEAAAVLPPATFPALACLSPVARSLGGKSDE